MLSRVLIATLGIAAAGLSGRRADAQLLLVSGNPGALSIVSAVPGSAPTPVSDAGTTYTVTTVQRSKIVVSINSAMPAGLTLTVTLAAPAGATSVGPVVLSTTPLDAVTGIPLLTLLATHSVTYTFSATVAAGPVASSTRTVTLTLLADP
jgi:hypothetical protein